MNASIEVLESGKAALNVYHENGLVQHVYDSIETLVKHYKKATGNEIQIIPEIIRQAGRSQAAIN